MKAIINFATGHYIKGQERLRQSLIDQGFDGEFMGFTHGSQIGAPQHNLNPYAFKCFAFDQALARGYKKILWVDASIWAIKPIESLWKCLDERGYVKQEAGHLCSTWSSDTQLQYFGITRDEAEKMPMHGNGGFFALDFDVPLSVEFFNRWKKAMMDGQFMGPWNNDNNVVSSDPRCKGTRHDMICGSIIANQLDMKAYPKDLLMAYVGGQYETPPESACFYAQGM